MASVPRASSDRYADGRRPRAWAPRTGGHGGHLRRERRLHRGLPWGPGVPGTHKSYLAGGDERLPQVQGADQMPCPEVGKQNC